jgi:hypothetical protein
MPKQQNRLSEDKILPDEVPEIFQDAEDLVSGNKPLERKLREYPGEGAKLSGGDIDAAWDQQDSGEETVSGSNPTPDQDVVDQLGQALGMTYEDNEPLRTTEKLEERDTWRWELNPASSEDYEERVNRNLRETSPSAAGKEQRQHHAQSKSKKEKRRSKQE